MTLPVLFLSHGSPMIALDGGEAGAAWGRLGAGLPAPRAILIASAHWETDAPRLTGAARPETVHDFHGFPAPLYAIRYPAPGEPALALRAVTLLAAAGIDAGVDATRGLDHGAWAPLLYLYPAADIPVVQVSVQTRRGPRAALELGRALAPLVEEGVLLIGSGHMTHNLREAFGPRSPDEGAYAHEFADWVAARLDAGDLETLLDYRRASPHGARAHPTEEHFLPFFFALGAAGTRRPERMLAMLDLGVLAMDAYKFQSS